MNGKQVSHFSRYGSETLGSGLWRCGCVVYKVVEEERVIGMGHRCAWLVDRFADLGAGSDARSDADLARVME